MTKKEFLQAVSNGSEDILQIFLDVLSKANIEYCVIGGLGVNAYAEPVVSLDLDIVIATKDIDSLCELLQEHFKIERFEHSIKLSTGQSDLRIQIQTDPRYQDFIKRAISKNVLGYEMKVAAIEDILQGKLWAYSDRQRRMSKRQKDLADIMRLVDVCPSLADRLPESIRKIIEG